MARISAGALAAAGAAVTFLAVRVPISQWPGVLAMPARHALYGPAAMATTGARQQPVDL